MAQNPPIPSFIFRGHASAVHALHFFQSNRLLVSGDSAGWIIVWSLATKRPVAVWKGHEGGIMAVGHWGADRLLSHGRDHAFRVWQLRSSDLEGLNVEVPVEGATAEQNKQPWLLHSMPANALNYCAFSACAGDPASTIPIGSETLLIATPNGLDTGGIDIFQLPSQQRINQVPSNEKDQAGMVMAISLVRQSENQHLLLLAGFESGYVRVQRRMKVDAGAWSWETLMGCKPHSQPILSIDTTCDTRFFITSSADAIIAKFETPVRHMGEVAAVRTINTKHAGQQDITIRDDDKIFATAGWDKRIRVYSLKTLKELAVLKWHQEGCYAVAFADTTMKEDFNVGEDVNKILTKTTLEVMKDDRSMKSQNTHWLAAGAKDGKISLWDIY